MSKIRAEQIGTPDNAHTYDVAGLGPVDTVSDMTAKSYPAGAKVSTLGYYTAGDGGQADYLVQTAVDYGGTPDGYGDHALSNGNVAVLQHNGVVNVKQFGAVGDGVTDDNAAIMAALSASDSTLFIFGANRTFVSESAINMPNGTQIDLNGSTLKFVVDGDVQNLVLGDNCSCYNGTIENLSTGVVSSGHYQTPIVIGDYPSGSGVSNTSIRDLEISNNLDNGNGVIVTGDSSNVVIENIVFPDSTMLGRSIAVHWGGSDVYATTGTTHPHGIQIKNIKAGKMTNASVDAGVIFLSACHGVDISEVYADETSRALIHIFAGDYGYYYASEEDQSLAFRDIRINGCHSTKSNDFGFRIDLAATLGAAAGIIYDSEIEFNNCSTYGTLVSSGFTVAKCSGITLKNCSAKNHTYGVVFGESVKECDVIGGKYSFNSNDGIIITNSTVQPENCKVIGVTAHGNGTQANSAGIHIADAKRCLVRNCSLGLAVGETQVWGVRLTNDAVDCQVLSNNVIGVGADGIAYVLGSSTTYGVVSAFDNNIAESAITFQSGVNPVQVGSTGRGVYKRKLLLGSVPTSGTWDKGDTVYYDSPVLGPSGSIGQVCVVSGTPGTWIPFGSTQSSSAYTATNVTTDRSFDANVTTTEELADVLGTLIFDLQSSGVLR